MAEKRMFAKSIVLSDAFLDMPMSARCLYFTLSMLADDDGFVGAPKSVMRQCGASQDDLTILLAKRYLLSFDSGVIVIKHWRINNYLRSDRYTATTYVEEKSTLTFDEKGSYTERYMDGIEYLPSDPERNIKSDDDEPKLKSDGTRKKAYYESDLPLSFDRKIRECFNGKSCPVCGCTMTNSKGDIHGTSIQHNIPISKGGKHEISNISVICHSCNVKLKDTPTGNLNNKEVVEAWKMIYGIPRYTTGIPSIDKSREDIEEIKEDTPYGVSKKDDAAAAAAPAEEKHSYGEYGWVKLTDKQYKKLLSDLGEDELNRCIQYIDESAQINKNKNKWSDWNAVIRKCNREGWGLKQKGGTANNAERRSGGVSVPDAKEAHRKWNVHYDVGGT